MCFCITGTHIRLHTPCNFGSTAFSSFIEGSVRWDSVSRQAKAAFERRLHITPAVAMEISLVSAGFQVSLLGDSPPASTAGPIVTVGPHAVFPQPELQVSSLKVLTPPAVDLYQVTCGVSTAPCRANPGSLLYLAGVSEEGQEQLLAETLAKQVTPTNACPVAAGIIFAPSLRPLVFLHSLKLAGAPNMRFSGGSSPYVVTLSSDVQVNQVQPPAFVMPVGTAIRGRETPAHDTHESHDKTCAPPPEAETETVEWGGSSEESVASEDDADEAAASERPPSGQDAEAAIERPPSGQDAEAAIERPPPIRIVVRAYDWDGRSYTSSEFQQFYGDCARDRWRTAVSQAYLRTTDDRRPKPWSCGNLDFHAQHDSQDPCIYSGSR